MMPYPKRNPNRIHVQGNVEGDIAGKNIVKKVVISEDKADFDWNKIIIMFLAALILFLVGVFGIKFVVDDGGFQIEIEEDQIEEVQK